MQLGRAGFTKRPFENVIQTFAEQLTGTGVQDLEFARGEDESCVGDKKSLGNEGKVSGNER